MIKTLYHGTSVEFDGSKEYNKTWLDYILKNRNKFNQHKDDYDVVIGLMADGKIKELMKAYISDFIPEDGSDSYGK